MNSWVWSAVFHTRDFPVTEKLDYFSAMAALLVSLIMTLHRIFRIRLYGALSIVFMITAVSFFVIHVCYLSLFRFDYGYIAFAN